MFLLQKIPIFLLLPERIPLPLLLLLVDYEVISGHIVGKQHAVEAQQLVDESNEHEENRHYAQKNALYSVYRKQYRALTIHYNITKRVGMKEKKIAIRTFTVIS